LTQFLLFVFGVVLGIIGYKISTHNRASKLSGKLKTAITEFWVYSPNSKLPDEKELMDRVVGSNPHYQNGVNPIGPKEGLVFSDVRWKLSRLLREKNPNVFDISTQSEKLLDELTFVEDLINQQAVFKLQYVSSDPLPDKRHLQFMLHVADAICEKNGGKWVFDCLSGRLWKPDDLRLELSKQLDVTDWKLHVSLSEGEGHTFETHGLSKIGLRDVTTLPVQHDNVHLLNQLLEVFLPLAWSNSAYPKEIEAYGDKFLFSVKAVRNGKSLLHISRMQVTR
jgi:hypothetical protein